ncbi:MAG: helix-turn-helix transcriptional regulator [Kiritimatiellia bacterium]
MANLGKVLKDEIVRISRKNALAFAKPMKAELRSLKRQLAGMALELKAVRSAAQRMPAVAVSENAEGAEAKSARAFTGKSIKSLRRKLKLTQVELARLAHVSPQSVVMWERKKGKIRLRRSTFEQMALVRLMNRAQAKAALNGKAAKKGV